jgi:hypothetical protein
MTSKRLLEVVYKFITLFSSPLVGEDTGEGNRENIGIITLSPQGRGNHIINF